MKAIKIPNCSFSGYYSLYKSDGVLVGLLVPGLWGSDNIRSVLDSPEGPFLFFQ